MGYLNWRLGSNTSTGTTAAAQVLTAAAVLSFAPVALAAAGSGGSATIESLMARQYLLDPSSTSIRFSRVNVLSTAEQLDYLRDNLGLSITDLSELLGVARPTVYAWLKGADVRSEHTERLASLFQAGQALDSSDILSVSRLLRRPLSNGMTLLDLMKSGQPLSPMIPELTAIAEAELRQRLQRKGGKYLRSVAEVGQVEGVAGFVRGS